MKAIVTDDSKATRMILKKIMEDLDFEVRLAEDGGQLLDALTEEIPDVCLIDWNMPGMNGTEVIRVMRSHPSWSQIPSILVTDETRQDRIDSALEAGARGYMAKPFTVDSLRELLDEIGLYG